MESDDQAMLEKISRLTGQINAHKNQQSAGPEHQKHPAPVAGSYDYGNSYQTHGGAWRGYRGGGRGGYAPRGFRGGRAPVRNRTLVLNGGTAPLTNGEPAGEENRSPNSAASNYISKTDRHLQLINKTYFEKDSQNRAKAIEETRSKKLKERDDREKAKFGRHLQRLGTGSVAPATRSSQVTGNYEIIVHGVRFQVAQNGSKLIKVPGQALANPTPKLAVVGGVKFHRSKTGNLYRSSIIKAQRKHTIVKINEPCAGFTTTGSCNKGPKCGYTHDPSKVAVCLDYLLKGFCQNGDACDLSHDLTPERTPACLHFAKGNCTNGDCRYTHVRVSPGALVCRKFATLGYCEKGATCQERHVHECPEYSNTGKCSVKNCKLPHKLKASVIRKNTPAASSGEDDELSDISSDEEEVDSDDVDSDAIDDDFFGGGEGETDSAIPMQQDYVQLG